MLTNEVQNMVKVHMAFLYSQYHLEVGGNEQQQKPP